MLHVTPASGRVVALAVAIASALSALPLAAQDQGGVPPEYLQLDGAPPPVLPESITRDARGRATVRAIRLDVPIELDGRLDDAVYGDYQPFGDFVQVAPVAGDPASERSDIWVAFDEENIYITCRCWDSAPPGDWVINELRRDASGTRDNEHLGVMFDTFYDRRNGSIFYANPLGARSDFSIADEGSPNRDWNPVWDVAGGEFDGGWVVEMRIPFKSLRYDSGADQVWGFQLRRSVRHKNEWAYLSPVPALYAGPQGLNRVSTAGSLVGLDLPPAGNNLEIKPYAIGGVATDRVSDPVSNNDVTGDIGLDFKYGITANLTADVTFNTDFAQVEVDEQQVNLTRFSLFFPEKRDFFLEGSGVFQFGQGGSAGFGGGGGGGGFGRGGGDQPTLFYSRRVGLDQDEVVPIQAGGRVTGKVGPATVGALSLRTGGIDGAGIEPTTYSVVRVKQDVLERSSIGALFTNRSLAESGVGANRAYGVDGTFALTQDLELGAYWAQTDARGIGPDNGSWEAAGSYAGDRYGATASRLEVGADFDPGVGFLRRSDFAKTAGSVRFSPRPASIEAIRKLSWEASIDHFADGTGALESRKQSGQFRVEMENSDQYTVEVVREFERIDEPFDITSDLDIPVGSYTFTSYRASIRGGSHRPLSGNLSYQFGDFYHGSIHSINANQGRIVASDQLSLEPGFSLNLIDLPEGESTQAVFRLRADFAFTPRMFVSSLLQYNEADDVLSSNLRFRWEYLPGSELFLVWTDERETGPRGSGLRTRGFTLKATRLLRY